MSEGLYRILKLVLLAIFVFGSLLIGSGIAKSISVNGARSAENGRYLQLDHNKDWHRFASSDTRYETYALDTRTGKVVGSGKVVPTD